MSRVPSLYVQSSEPRCFIHTEHPLVRGAEVVLDPSAQAPTPPAFRIPEGTVIVRKRGQRSYVLATDPAGERCLPAEVVSLQAPDAAWAGTVVTASLALGLGYPVLLDAQATTVAEVVTQLNRDPAFAAHFLADDRGGLVRIRTREAGGHKVLRAESSYLLAFGPDGREAKGSDADYRVTDATGEVRDIEGRPIEALVSTIVAGHFRTAELIAATPEALSVLARRGSLFHPR